MIHTFTTPLGIPMLARLVKVGEGYGRNFTLRAEQVMVEFYDQRYPHTILGQFVSRYNRDTLLEHEGGLCLDGGVPAWTISAENFEGVMQALGMNG